MSMMCCTLDDVLYIELVAELSVNITFKHILVQPMGRGVISLFDCFLFHDQLKEEEMKFKVLGAHPRANVNICAKLEILLSQE